MAQTNKYNVTFKRFKTKLVVVYHNGQFKRLEYKSGGVKDNFWLHLTKAIPFMEHHIKDVVFSLENRVNYDLIETKVLSEYTQFLDEYFMFFELNYKFNPKINATEGKALKELIKYLNSISSTKDEALNIWKQLLNNWKCLDEFYQNQNQLKQINSNLTTLLIQLKNGNSKTGTTNNERVQASNSIVDEYFKK
jgi:hypothetical protein